MTEKTMTRDQVKSYILANSGRFGSTDAVNFARQLYEAMGEIEQLKKTIDSMVHHYD